MTSPSALPPHQDPVSQTDLTRVSILEYVTTLVASLDRRFDAMHRDLKDTVSYRFDGIQRQLADAKEAVGTAMAAAEKATTKAEAASEKRFESVNEFRGQLADQAASLMPRSEAEARFTALAEKVDALSAARDKADGLGAGLNRGWGYLLGGVGAIVVVVNLIIYIVTSR